MRVDQPAEHGVRVHEVFADQKIQRFSRFRRPQTDARREIRNDEFERLRADAGDEHIRVRDRARGGFGVPAVYGADGRDDPTLGGVRAHKLERISSRRVQSVDEGSGDVEKYDFIARVGKNLTDEAAPDVAGSDDDCVFHDTAPSLRN